MPAALIGFGRGGLFFDGHGPLKQKFGYEHSLDAFGVHGAGGTLGAASHWGSTTTGHDALRIRPGK